MVVAGTVVQGPHVRASCARHLRDLEHGAARGLWWDVAAAQRVIGYFRDVLRLKEGQFEGQPFELEGSQCFIVGSIFGWKKASGFRRFRRAYVEEGKGNGKSPMAGGIGLYMTTADDEAGAQVYSAGARREQADILFQDAVSMAERSPALMRRLTFSGVNPVWNIADLGTGSFFKPISREAGRTGSGPRPHAALVDELHEHPDRFIVEMLERGFKFRRQPLLFQITNAGISMESVCREEHDHAVRVAHGQVEDDETFSFVCALDEGDDPLEDESCWGKVNPLLGKVIQPEYLRGVVAQAKMIPGKLNNILRLHFCVWTDADAAWMGRGAWEACEVPADAMRIEDYEGLPCWLAVDLSYTQDLTGMGLVFDPLDGREDGFDLFVEFWTPRETLRERSLRDRTPYDEWVKDGHVVATEGKVIKMEQVAARVAQVRQRHDVRALGYDRYRHKELEEELDELGLGGLVLVEHPQGFRRAKDTPLWMPDSVEIMENAVVEGTMRTPVNPALRYCVSSAVTRPDPAGTANRVFDKRKSRGKIDGLVAGAMAAGVRRRFMASPPRDYGSFLRSAVMVDA